MKRFLTVTLALCLFCAPMAAVAGPEHDHKVAAAEPWFDMANCDMCKGLTSVEGLMDNLHWENHSIATGCISVAVPAAGYEAKWHTAQANMGASAKRMQAGEKLKVCGYCQSVGSLMGAGAKMENVETKGGSVMLITATDPAVVGKIHAHVAKVNEEMAKMMEAQKAAAAQGSAGAK